MYYIDHFQVSDYFILNALQVAFSQVIKHREESYTMPEISAPCVEKLAVQVTNSIPVGYQFNESTNEGT